MVLYIFNTVHLFCQYHAIRVILHGRATVYVQFKKRAGVFY